MPTPIPAPAVFPFDPDGGFPLRERWIYATDVLVARSGRERRVGLVFLPRLNISWAVTGIDAGEAARLLALLWTETDNRWYVPRWTSGRTYTKAGSVYTMQMIATDFFTTGKALVWRSSKLYDVMTVDSQNSTSITLSGATTFDHTLPGNIVVPLMVGSFTQEYDIERGALTGRIDLTFSIDVSDYAYTPPVGVALQSYRGKELFTDVAHTSEQSEGSVMRTDISGGMASSKFIVRPLDERLTQVLRAGYAATSRQEYQDLKQFLARRAGRLNPCWVVASPEAVVATTAASGTNQLILQDMEFGTYYTADAARKDLVFMVGNTLYPHRVNSWTNLAPNSRANLETNLAVTVPAGTLVSFLRYCRMATDATEMEVLAGSVGALASLEFTEIPSEVPV